MLRRGEAGLHVQLRRRCRKDAERPDVPPLAKVELRCERQIRRQCRLAVLDRALRRIVERQRTVETGVRRLGIDAVELRYLIPQTRDHETPGALVACRVALIAPADVVRRYSSLPATRWLCPCVTHVGEEQAIPQILIALEARRISVNAGESTADLELPLSRLEQTARCVGSRRLGLRRWRRLRARCLPIRNAGQREREKQQQVKTGNAAHGSSDYRMKNCPDGWFEPWTFEWQLTHDRPNIRLLLFTVMALLS